MVTHKHFGKSLRKFLCPKFQVPSSKNCGFTFIEVVMAIFVMSIGIVGTLLAVQYAIFSTHKSYSRLVAAYLAQEGIEIIRNARDGNWLEQRTATTTVWDDGFDVSDVGDVKDWEVEYSTTTLKDPSCVFPCSFEDLDFLKKSDGGFYNYSLGGNDTQFKRKVTIRKVATTTLEVISRVYWDGGKHSIAAQENLYNWRSDH